MFTLNEVMACLALLVVILGLWVAIKAFLDVISWK